MVINTKLGLHNVFGSVNYCNILISSENSINDSCDNSKLIANFDMFCKYNESFDMAF